MMIKFNKKKFKSNYYGLNQKIKSNHKKIKRKINRNKKNKDQI
jgi:ubiquitin